MNVFFLFGGEGTEEGANDATRRKLACVSLSRFDFESQEPTPDAHQHAQQNQEEEEEEEEEIYSFPVDDNDDPGMSFANDNPSPSGRNDFLLSPSQSQPFAYDESQAVFGGATFKTQNSHSHASASDEMDVVGNDTNTLRVRVDGDVEMDEDEEEVAPMPSPLQVNEEEEKMHVVLSGEVGDSMPLGKKRVSWVSWRERESKRALSRVEPFEAVEEREMGG